MILLVEPKELQMCKVPLGIYCCMMYMSPCSWKLTGATDAEFRVNVSMTPPFDQEMKPSCRGDPTKIGD